MSGGGGEYNQEPEGGKKESQNTCLVAAGRKTKNLISVESMYKIIIESFYLIFFFFLQRIRK